MYFFSKRISAFYPSIILIVLACGILLHCPSIANANPPVKVRRFALIMGANDGGKYRMQLRYARSDAFAFAKVLGEIGGVRKNDQLLLTSSEKIALQQAFTQMKQRLLRAQKNTVKLEMIFYYSGHSDERGLLLNDEIFSFKDLKKQLDEMPAKVKIGILDSCASGALVRIKGGKRIAPFLMDSSTEVSGYALLTSSSADESAQESERIGASYFTHYLISGLRGAADTNRDGRVTLNESYAYAFDETLYRTESSRGGPQHPNYDFQLAGAGDLVLTDLRSTDASLVIPKQIEGRIFIRDNKGRLVAEINKSSKKEIHIALPTGRYEVAIDNGSQLKKGYIRVTPDAEARMDTSRLATINKEQTRFRGGQQTDTVSHQQFAATVSPSLTTNASPKVENNLAANIIGAGWSLRGLEVGLVLNRRDFSVHGAQISLLANKTLHLTGMQRGSINFARGDIIGVQIGAINIGGTYIKGAQLGIFNATKEKSNAAQFGLINYMPDGILTIGAWASDSALFNVGLKLGGRYTFSKFVLSTRAKTDNNWFSFAYGFGGHFEFSNFPLWLEIDTTGHWLVSDLAQLDSIDFLIKSKLSVGVRLYNTLSFFIGPVINTLISDRRTTIATLPAIATGTMNTDGPLNYEISPGFFIGFQIEPKIQKFNTWKNNLD